MITMATEFRKQRSAPISHRQVKAWLILEHSQIVSIWLNSWPAPWCPTAQPANQANRSECHRHRRAILDNKIVVRSEVTVIAEIVGYQPNCVGGNVHRCERYFALWTYGRDGL